MRSGSRQQIGLFTFYKTQEQEEEKLRGIYRKQRKGKSVKSRKAFKEAVRDRTKQKLPISEEDSDVWSESANERIYEQFLKNIPHKQAKSPTMMTQMEESLIHSIQLRTEPTLTEEVGAKRSRNIKVQIVQEAINKYNFVQEIQKIPPAKPTPRIEQLLHICQEKLCDNQSQSSTKVVKRDRLELTAQSKEFRRTPHKESKPEIRSPMMIKIERLMEERNLSKNVSFGDESLKEERKSNEEKADKGQIKEQKSFLEKLQLIEGRQQGQQSNREVVSLRTSHTTQELHQNNKKYFQNLMMRDLQLQPEVGTQVAFRILRQTLKFPQIPLSAFKTPKIETNPPSPVKKKLLNAPRSLSCHKKQLKARRGNGSGKEGREGKEGDNFYLLTEPSEPLMTKSKSNHISPVVLSHKNSKNYKKDDRSVVKLFKSRLQTQQ